MVHQAMNCGAFAERVVVDQSQVVNPCPTTCQPMRASADGLRRDHRGWCGGERRQAARGQDVVVIGAGGVGPQRHSGRADCRGAAHRGRRYDRRKAGHRQEPLAQPTVLLATDARAVERRVMRILGRGADVVAVTVGAIPAYNDAPRYLGWGGRMVMIGMPHSGAMAEYEPVVLAYMAQGMIGSKMGDVVIQRDIPWLADLYEQGRLKLDELVSGRWSLDQINEAIADTKAGDAKRNVILF